MYGEDSQQSEPDEDLVPQLLGTNAELLSPAVAPSTDATSTATTSKREPSSLHNWKLLLSTTQPTREFEAISTEKQILPE